MTLRRLTTVLFTAAVAAATLGGCARKPGPLEAEEITCSSWDRQPLPGSDAVIINNTWNEQWARGQSHSQCLLRRARGGVDQYGWRWSWPPYRPYSSYAAPEALFGWKAWDGGSSTTALLPEKIDALQSLTVDFAVHLETQGRYNLNTSLWIFDKMPASSRPDPSLVRDELMVWFAHEPRGFGGIDSDGEVTLGGVTFDVWHQHNHGDHSGGSSRAWTMIVYVSREQSFSRTFDLKLVLDDAVRKGLVDPGHVLGGVELINEIFGGSGELWLDHFQVTPVKRPVRETPSTPR